MRFEFYGPDELKTIINDYSGGPVGAETLAVSVSEENGTIEDV